MGTLKCLRVIFRDELLKYRYLCVNIHWTSDFQTKTNNNLQYAFILSDLHVHVIDTLGHIWGRT